MRHWILACVRDHTTTWMRPPRVEEFCGCDIGSASLVEEEVGRYGCSSQINARARSASSCIFQDEGQCQHKITCIAVPLLLLLHWRFFIGNLLSFTWIAFNISFGTTSPNAHTAHLSHITLRNPNTHQSNALSLVLDSKSFKHMLILFQYQVFQDLQGPASSLRVGSSVRTSTRPLSVSLLRLCLRYLTCIQRR
jgi:hypothetical protein